MAINNGKGAIGLDKEDTLYQHGTLALLVPGLLTGTLTIGELLEHGDYGIGTLQGLDGELTLVDGVGYLAQSDGNVVTVDPKETVPFANAHFQRATDKLEHTQITKAALEKEIMQNHDYENIFFAMKIHGVFSSVRTRVVAGNRQPPFKPLAIVAQNQELFSAENVTGTLVGYYSPELFQGVASAGFHVHFVSDDHQFGGHILDYALTQGTVELQRFENLDLHLPVHDSTYRKHRFDYDDMSAVIRSAEGNE
ncbi:alpha-acetolactate decarboxylase [Agrilactobacillus composti DSM 18527 = JCM 14202]|uniref:Alpha-acetolactate decarboxylase n=1 Tax=Agrilactobacillus composti DSM 18527 = JCM 14202 TaxID=1423734 RepID=A0A0R1Y146_9LACO|nr:alpha-acetolactate decarboxylase [Agrilactobacillus composti DSM 18527 = JCM 14202]